MNILKKISLWFYGLSDGLTKKYFHDAGRNNHVILVYPNGREKNAKPKQLKNIKVKFVGDNNLLKIHLPFDLRKSSFSFHSNNSVIEIGCESHMNLDIICGDENSVFSIGENCHAVGIEAVLCGNTVKIGSNCMFSKEIIIQEDTHSVLDYETHKILNREKTVLTIGNHCWIGRGVTLLKKAAIPNDCIVACDSVVTKQFNQEHCVIAGNPAMLVKQCVTWHSLSPSKYTEKIAITMPV